MLEIVEDRLSDNFRESIDCGVTCLAWQKLGLDLTCNLELFFQVFAMSIGAETQGLQPPPSPAELTRLNS